jgi:glycosyltransferase involved in cell wall biosynthesis
MQVGLNLVYLVPGETGGMETYARELIPALVRQAGDDIRFIAFVGREAAADRDAPWSQLIPAVTVPVNAKRRPDWVYGEQRHLPNLARGAGVDLVHSLATTAPLHGPFRRITTVHDLHFRTAPEAHFGLRGLGMRLIVPLVVRRSDRLIAISNQTRADLIRLLGADAARIDVIPQGAGTSRQVTPLPEPEVRARFRLDDRRVLLSPSAKRPHKNLLRLLEALALIPKPSRPILVLPGYRTPHEDELRHRAASLRLEDEVRFLDWVAAEELEGLYAASTCVVVPSLYEGFGLPALEAMSRGVPVACSETGALAEVAGSAALLFNPNSTGEIARAIERLLNEPRTAARLRAAGVERAQEFTWERTARATLESYDRALRSSPR